MKEIEITPYLAEQILISLNKYNQEKNNLSTLLKVIFESKNMEPPKTINFEIKDNKLTYTE